MTCFYSICIGNGQFLCSCHNVYLLFSEWIWWSLQEIPLVEEIHYNDTIGQYTNILQSTVTLFIYIYIYYRVNFLFFYSILLKPCSGIVAMTIDQWWPYSSTYCHTLFCFPISMSTHITRNPRRHNESSHIALPLNLL